MLRYTHIDINEREATANSGRSLGGTRKAVDVAKQRYEVKHKSKTEHKLTSRSDS